MIKYLLLIPFFFHAYTSFGQLNHYYGGDGLFEGKFGITVGATNYITDTNLLFSKSGTGFTTGLYGYSRYFR